VLARFTFGWFSAVAYRSLRTYAEVRIRRLGLIESDVAVRKAICPQRPDASRRQGELGPFLDHRRADRLEHRGLVERQGDRNDRRSRLAALTEEGSGLTDRAFADHQEALEETAASLPIEQHEQGFEAAAEMGALDRILCRPKEIDRLETEPPL
jgi:hypothetical protein